MKKFLFNVTTAVVGIGILWVVFFYWQNLRSIDPVVNSPGSDNTKLLPNGGGDESGNLTDLPLNLPDGFSISIFAKNLPGARVMAFDGLGNMWVSRSREGAVTLLEIKEGKVINQTDVFKNLKTPHGLAINYQEPLTLYIAEEDKVSRVKLYTEDSLHKIIDLPRGGGHTSRTIEFGPQDNLLYVSIGSSCNVCNESDARRAAIYTANADGADFKPFATGLRNTVFFDWSYVDGQMWGTDMGRDYLGDNLPPDEINKLQPGKDYGWPICFGKNVHDTQFDRNQYVRDPCEDKEPSVVDLPAHSAPLGLGFVPEEGWPEEMWYDLIVAFHGSWNRSEPTGYKLVRVKLDAQGNYLGTEDFVTSWLASGEVLGRPVDVLIQVGGVMYVSDDHAGVIYKITYNNQ